MLVREASRHHFADDRQRLGRIVDGIVGRRPLGEALGYRALHRTDVIAPLAYAAPRLFEAWIEPPEPTSLITGEPPAHSRPHATPPQRRPPPLQNEGAAPTTPS